jgi:hypothetical protein
VSDDADLFYGLGIDGADAFEFMREFATIFAVDIKNYRWYFHHGEEGFNPGGLFFRPPYRRVKHEPITINVLLKAVNAHSWPLRYPTHELPKVRWDLRFNLILVFASLIPAAVWALRRLVR